MSCSICLDSIFNSQIICFRCNHTFHKKCVYQLYMNSDTFKCPLCRILHPLGLRYEKKHIIEKYFLVIDELFKTFFNCIVEQFTTSFTNIFKTYNIWSHLFFWYIRSFQSHINHLQSILLTYEKHAHFVFWAHGLKILPNYNFHHI